jgi:hypothetical protein
VLILACFGPNPERFSFPHIQFGLLASRLPTPNPAVFVYPFQWYLGVQWKAH